MNTMGRGDAYLYAVVIRKERNAELVSLYDEYMRLEEEFHEEDWKKDGVDFDCWARMAIDCELRGYIISHQISMRARYLHQMYKACKHALYDVIYDAVWIDSVANDSVADIYNTIVKIRYMLVKDFIKVYENVCWISEELSGYGDNMMIILPCHEDNTEDFYDRFSGINNANDTAKIIDWMV